MKRSEYVGDTVCVGETVGDIIVTDNKSLGGAVLEVAKEVGSFSRKDKTTPTAIAMAIATSTSPNTMIQRTVRLVEDEVIAVLGEFIF
jgi:hypothetical protein